MDLGEGYARVMGCLCMEDTCVRVMCPHGSNECSYLDSDPFADFTQTGGT
jgi:hypothetical protein